MFQTGCSSRFVAKTKIRDEIRKCWSLLCPHRLFNTGPQSQSDRPGSSCRCRVHPYTALEASWSLICDLLHDQRLHSIFMECLTTATQGIVIRVPRRGPGPTGARGGQGAGGGNTLPRGADLRRDSSNDTLRVLVSARGSRGHAVFCLVNFVFVRRERSILESVPFWLIYSLEHFSALSVYLYFETNS